MTAGTNFQEVTCGTNTVKIKVRVKFTLEEATKAQRGVEV